MIRSRFIHSLSILAAGLSFLAAGPAAKAENPLEKLRNHILGDLFGDHHNGDKDHGKKKKKHKDDDRYCDDRDRGSSGGWSLSFGLQPLIETQLDDHGSYAGPVPAPRNSVQSHPLEQDVQAALQREGYYRGSIDGDLDSSTRAAIRDYQSDHGLTATGRISRELLHSLGL